MTIEEYVNFHERWKGAVMCAEMRGWKVKSHSAVEHFEPDTPVASTTNTLGVVLHGQWRVKEDAKIEVHGASANPMQSNIFYRTQAGLEALLRILAETGTT